MFNMWSVAASRQDEWPVLWPRVQGLYRGPAKMTLGECWRVLALHSDEWNQADSEDRSSRRDVAQELYLESRHNWSHGATASKRQPLFVRTVTACELLRAALTCLLSPAQRFVPCAWMLHRERGPGLLGFQNMVIKVWKGLENWPKGEARNSNEM